MPRYMDISPERRNPAAPGCRTEAGGESLQALIAALRELGFAVPPFGGVQGNVAGGVPLEVPVRSLLKGPAGTGNAIRNLLRERVPVTLALTDLGGGGAAIEAVRGFLGRLRSDLEDIGHGGECVGIAIPAQQMPLAAFQAVSAAVPGPRLVLLDGATLAYLHGRHSASELDWELLWRHRSAQAQLQPAYGAMVRPGCSLLADEAAASVLPVFGVQVPAGSAWLPLGLDLGRFADAGGELRWERLSGAVAAGLEISEELMARLNWPHPGQRADAATNRRLAVSVVGLGDLVARRGLDPRQLDTLNWLFSIVARLRNALWETSGRLAQKNGCLPALHQGDPSQRWDDSDHREHWRRRWQDALEKSAVRHRNILVLSPYAVLPSGGNADPAYTDLLPVIAQADAWSFADVPRLDDFDRHDFTTFHRRAWAVIRGRRADSLIAAGV